MAGTTVTYNGVTMKNVRTVSCEQDIILDPSGTDMIGDRVTLSFLSYVHTQDLREILHGTTVGSYPAAISNINFMYQQVEARLREPRAPLLVEVGSTPLYAIYPAADAGSAYDKSGRNVDINNGPHPQRVRIEAIAGDQAFRISFTIQFMVSGCASPNGVQGPNIVINNRWSVSESRDAQFYTTRRINGHIRFRNSKYTPHAYLPWCIPALEDGFRRDSVEFEAMPNGLEATYSIVDRQTKTAAPYPAARIDGSYSWSTNLEGGTWLHAAEVNLYGHPGSNPQELLQVALQVADARVEFVKHRQMVAEKKTENNLILRHLSISERIGDENQVSVRMEITYFPDKYDVVESIGNLVAGRVGKRLTLPARKNLPPYNPNESPLPSLYGTNPDGSVRTPAALFLLHCYLQDPCGDMKSVYNPTPPQKPRKKQIKDRYPTKAIGNEVSAVDPGNVSSLSADNADRGIYTYYRVSSTYTRKVPRIHVPVAKTLNRQPKNPTAYAVRIGGDIATRTIRVEAERVGAPVELPPAADAFCDENGIKYALSDHWFESPAVRVGPDGIQRVFSMTAVYVYFMSRPPTAGETLTIGRLPFQNFERKLTHEEIYSLPSGNNQ